MLLLALLPQSSIGNSKEDEVKAQLEYASGDSGDGLGGDCGCEGFDSPPNGIKDGGACVLGQEEDEGPAQDGADLPEERNHTWPVG